MHFDQPLLFSGNKYVVRMPRADYETIVSELTAGTDSQLYGDGNFAPAGEKRWIATPGDGVLPGEDKVLFDVRNGNEASDFLTLTLETDQTPEQKVTDLWLMGRLKATLTEEGLLAKIVETVIKRFSTENKSRQTFGFNIKSLFPDIDYENILTPDLVENPNRVGQNDKFHSRLSEAIKKGDKKTLDALLAHPDIDVNYIPDKGAPPLIWAAHLSNIDAIEKLLMFDNLEINKTEPGHPTRTALWYAQNNGYAPIIELLKANGAE